MTTSKTAARSSRKPKPGVLRGSDVLIEVLRSEGVKHIFGNPGTTELPLVDALSTAPDLRYILGLQEAAVVGMADGYAQATGRPAFVNLHTTGGLGNGYGALTNAQQVHVPLVVTAGQQDYRHITADPWLSGDLVSIARPVSKWAHEIRSVDELGVILRRAFKDAATPPGGPVFVGLPMNFLMEETSHLVPPRSVLSAAPHAPTDSLEELARLLSESAPGEVALVLGEDVRTSLAEDAAVELAEALGAPVFGAPVLGNTAFPTGHPLWRGPLPPRADAIRASLSSFRRVLLIGARAFMVYPYSDGSPVPEGTELLHLSPDPVSLARVHPVRLGVAGDPRNALNTLASLLGGTRGDAREALDTARDARERARLDLEARIHAAAHTSPLPPEVAAHAVLAGLPSGTVVVDEAPATNAALRGQLVTSRAGQYYFAAGGALGWAMPAAVGMSLGLNHEPVLCMLGDGAAMYSPQALWSAAHERTPVVFVVVNNREYNVLKNYMRHQPGYHARDGHFIGMDLGDPPIDYVALATSMGVPAYKVERHDDIADTVRSAFARGGPTLVEVPISPD